MTAIDTAAAEPTARPLRKDAARNRELLLAAARDVFAERGLDASLDDVARAAGVGVGTAYRHFGNKYELAKAIFQQRIEDVVSLAERACATADPWEGIVAFIEGVAAAQADDRGLREVLMGVHDSEQVEQIQARMTGPLTDLVERAKRESALRPDVDVTDIGILVVMLCTVADVAGDKAPDLWRRYLPMLLIGLQSGVVLPAPPLAESQFREAMSQHKQRMWRSAPSR